MTRTNYDLIARKYDEDRDHRVYGPHWLPSERLAAGATDLAILDLGCGPGRWLQQQMAHFTDRPIRWIGLDPFAGMLELARRHAPRAEYVQAGAERIPFPDASLDLIVASVSFHHVEDKERGLDEIARTLKPDGVFEMGDIHPWSMPNMWTYRYFPESWELDTAKHWPIDRLLAGLRQRGFTVAEPALAPSRYTSDVDDLLHVAGRRTMSQLASLDEAAYARGLERLRRQRAEHPGERVEDEFSFYGSQAVKSFKPFRAR